MGKSRSQRAEGEKRAKRNRLIIILAVVIAIALVGINVIGCGSEEPAGMNNGDNHQDEHEADLGDTSPVPSDETPNNGTILATWIEPEVYGDTVTVAVSELDNYGLIHFELEVEGESLTFMAYSWDGVIYVRANVCPPCKSIGYSLSGGILVCDRCATTFEADTGNGIQGACVDFPKAAASYEVINDNITLNTSDLVNAYEDTILPGWP